MADFVLRRKEPDTLRLTIGDDVFQIPLAGSLTPDEAAKLDTQVGTIAFFNKYIPKKVSSGLTINEYNAITKAWIEASKKEGVAPGES